MSKFLKIPYGDYTIEVQDGGELKLDTGPSIGTVRITGNLIVDGSTSTVINSIDTAITDNIIILNDGETGNGVSKIQSGIRVDRGERLGGTEKDVFLAFDENLQYLDSYTRLIDNGVFAFYKNVTSNKLIGIRTNSITTDGSDLLLLGNEFGTISVTGSGNYASRVVDENDIPNKAYVDSTISNAVGSGSVIRERDTKVEAHDFDETGIDSNIDFQVDGTTVVNISELEMKVYDLKIIGKSITTTELDDNLTLVVSGDGSVRIEKVLEIAKSTVDPAIPIDGIKIYNKEPAEGGSGVYIKREDGTSDELISRNRALLYSMVI